MKSKTFTRIIAYIIEGSVLAVIVTTLSTLSPLVSEKITGDEENATMQWVNGVIIGIISYVISESFRHDRFVSVLSNIRKPVFDKFTRQLTNSQPDMRRRFANVSSTRF